MFHILVPAGAALIFGTQSVSQNPLLATSTLYPSGYHACLALLEEANHVEELTRHPCAEGVRKSLRFPSRKLRRGLGTSFQFFICIHYSMYNTGINF